MQYIKLYNLEFADRCFHSHLRSENGWEDLFEVPNYTFDHIVSAIEGSKGRVLTILPLAEWTDEIINFIVDNHDIPEYLATEILYYWTVPETLAKIIMKYPHTSGALNRDSDMVDVLNHILNNYSYTTKTQVIQSIPMTVDMLYAVMRHNTGLFTMACSESHLIGDFYNNAPDDLIINAWLNDYNLLNNGNFRQTSSNIYMFLQQLLEVGTPLSTNTVTNIANRITIPIPESLVYQLIDFHYAFSVLLSDPPLNIQEICINGYLEDENRDIRLNRILTRIDNSFIDVFFNSSIDIFTSAEMDLFDDDGKLELVQRKPSLARSMWKQPLCVQRYLVDIEYFGYINSPLPEIITENIHNLPNETVARHFSKFTTDPEEQTIILFKYLS